MGRGQQSQSVAPLMDSLSSAFVTQQRPTPGEKALGAAASLGLSLAILRLVVHYAKTKDNNYMIGGDLSSSASSDLVDENDSVFSWYKFVKHLVRRILEDSSAVFKASTSSVNRNQVDDGIVITHLGSCHCESVEFEVGLMLCGLVILWLRRLMTRLMLTSALPPHLLLTHIVNSTGPCS